MMEQRRQKTRATKGHGKDDGVFNGRKRERRKHKIWCVSTIHSASRDCEEILSTTQNALKHSKDDLKRPKRYRQCIYDTEYQTQCRESTL